MLYNELLVDVFRWLDRRFIELRLRPAGRQSAALINAHLPTVPRLADLDALVFNVDEGGVSRFELEFRRDKPPVDAQRRLPRPPFDGDSFDAFSVPRYVAAAARLRLAVDPDGGARRRDSTGPIVQVTERRRQHPPFSINYIFSFSFPRRSNLKACLAKFLARSWTPAGMLSIDLAEARVAVLPADPIDGLLTTPALSGARQLTLRDLLDECDEPELAGCVAWLHLPLDMDGQKCEADEKQQEGRTFFAPCWSTFDYNAFVDLLVAHFLEDTWSAAYTATLSASYRDRRPAGERRLEHRSWRNTITSEVLVVERFAPSVDDEPGHGAAGPMLLVALEEAAAAVDEDDDEEDSDYDDRDERYSGEDDERWLLVARRWPAGAVIPS